MRKIAKVIHWSLLGLTLVYILTGFGITQFRIIEKYSFGLLTKSLSFRIHSALIVPFLLALALHVYFVLKKERLK